MSDHVKRTCWCCGSPVRDGEECRNAVAHMRDATVVSPHAYATCGVDCLRRTPHCDAHCGFDRADPIHDVPSEAVLEVA